MHLIYKRENFCNGSGKFITSAFEDLKSRYLSLKGGLAIRILRACAMIPRSKPSEYWGWEVGTLICYALLLALLGW